MAKLKWDNPGEHFYETGVRNCVLFVQNANGTYGTGVPWNGITTITESPSGAESTSLYADDIKYLNLLSVEEFGATIEAYTYPDAFAECNGEAQVVTGLTLGQQARKSFAFCYRTAVGNDTVGSDYGYKLHIVYGAQASPSERSYQTMNENPEANTFSWEIKTTPVNVKGNYKATSLIVIDSKKVDADKLAALEDLLYGKDADEDAGTLETTSSLPLPDAIIDMFKVAEEEEEDDTP